MASFTTRVELHTATWNDYEKLHAAMEAAGFSRFITSGEGVKYHLPTAEYDLVGNYTRQQVLAKAEAAAKTTGKRYGALVTEAAGRTWNGLDKA